MSALPGSKEGRMDKRPARALLAGERARLERLLAAEPGGLGAPNVGDEIDDAARREAGETRRGRRPVPA
jgi:hypothetical protein